MRRFLRRAAVLALLLLTLAVPAAPAVNLASMLAPVECGGGASGDFNNDGFADLAIGVPGENAAAGAVSVIYGDATGLSTSRVGDQLWTQDSAGVQGDAEAGDNFGYAVAVGNFDDDAYDDLAIGVPYENLTTTDAGRVNIIYGSSSGLSTTARVDQTFIQGSNDVSGVGEQDDHFGFALATGDPNGDGYADLAIGVPGEDGGAGGAAVIYGSPTGLSATALVDEFWSQDTLGMDSGEEAGDEFGFSLTIGDFNRDGRDDLAAGVPNEDGIVPDQGAVHVVYGVPGGLSATTKADQLWLQDSPDIHGDAEAGDLFGWSVTSGDFNGDRYCDLATGVPGEAVGAVDDSGAVNVIYGSSSGLTANSPANQIWHRDSPDINGDPVAGAEFGYSVAAGNFNGDDESDLAIGAPADTVNGQFHAGSVSVIHGSGGGLSAISPGDQLWSQESADVTGTAQPHDHFGHSLTVGDFTWDSWNGIPLFALAIGVPGEDGDTGAVQVLYPWADTGLDPSGISDDQWWIQGSDGLNGSRVAGDRFGAALR
jgi:hypothetical protein